VKRRSRSTHAAALAANWLVRYASCTKCRAMYSGLHAVVYSMSDQDRSHTTRTTPLSITPLVLWHRIISRVCKAYRLNSSCRAAVAAAADDEDAGAAYTWWRRCDPATVSRRHRLAADAIKHNAVTSIELHPDGGVLPTRLYFYRLRASLCVYDRVLTMLLTQTPLFVVGRWFDINLCPATCCGFAVNFWFFTS